MYFSILSHKPYRMVFVSLIATLLYLSLLIFLRFYRKKPLNVVLTLLGFSILPIISIFRQGSYESGDLTINMAKLMSFYSALSEGQLIPHWAGELNATYGYPNFIFAYPLPYYLGSLYHFFGLSFLNSLKLVLITSYISSGLAMYFWLKNHVSERFARLPFVGGLVLLFFALYPQAFWLPSLGRFLLFLLVIVLTFCLRFLIQYTFALFAFWLERASAIEQFWFLIYLFLSGLVAPLEVFPAPVREVVLWTPFPYLIHFPASILIGLPVDVGRGLLVMLGWAAVFFVWNRWLWRQGLKQYSGMGA